MNKPLHTILMKEKGGDAQATYKNVIRCETRFGCELVLFLATGETATFDADNWEMWDLTPCKGWNDYVHETLPVDDTFGEVKWSEDDIEETLVDTGFAATLVQIAHIRQKCEHHSFTDHMISAGWDWIYTCVHNEWDNLADMEADQN